MSKKGASFGAQDSRDSQFIDKPNNFKYCAYIETVLKKT
jgi:hypothetical protein